MTNLWCIHGNLQRPSAWRSFEGRWRVRETEESSRVLPLRCVDLWADEPSGFRPWVGAFCDRIASESAGIPQWLMGYSLGGRLALHALLERPRLWAGVIAIAAHPGLADQAEREAQLQRDHAWGKRFLTDSWDRLMADWDALPVFVGRPNPFTRIEKDFDRRRVAHLFDVFSKGRQDDLTPALAALTSPPVLLISGETDLKYNHIAKQLTEIFPAATHVSLPNAGHRAPWEAPDAFTEAVQKFLTTNAPAPMTHDIE